MHGGVSAYHFAISAFLFSSSFDLFPQDFFLLSSSFEEEGIVPFSSAFRPSAFQKFLEIPRPFGSTEFQRNHHRGIRASLNYHQVGDITLRNHLVR
jgi:hypothetical protein